MPPNRTAAPRSAVRALLAALALAVLVVGIPLALAVTVGNPLDGWAALTAGDLSDIVLIDVLAGVAYLAWAQFALAVLAEFVSALTGGRGLHRTGGRRPPRLPLVLPAQQQLAHTLVAAVLMLGPATPLATATAATPLTHATGVEAVATAARVPTPVAAEPTAAGTTTYTVTTDGPGTLWDLATTTLGRGERWQEIWDLNRGRTQPDGTTMTDPGLLRVGWTLLLPATGAGASPAAPSPLTVDLSHAETRTVVVEVGDTLSAVAARNDVADWHRLWQANADRAQPGGKQLTDPDHIEPGWRLTLPDPVAAHGPQAHTEAPQVAAAPAPTVARPTSTTTSVATPTSVPAADPSPVPSAADIAPTTDPTTPSDTAAADDPSSLFENESDGSALLATVFGAGGGLFAGVILLEQQRRQRRRARHRRPGRAVVPISAGARPLARALRTAGTRDVLWMDAALRGLAQQCADDPHRHLPDVIAVGLDPSGVQLVLATADAYPPGAWTAREEGRRWHLPRHADTGYDPGRRETHVAPYPALVTLGVDPTDGVTWMVDLEHIGLLHVTAAGDRGRALARFMAAELAHNPWPELVWLRLAGLGEEFAGLDWERLTVATEPTAIESAVSKTRWRLHDVEATALDTTDVLTGRLRDIHGDVWFPELLFLDAGAVPATARELVADLEHRFTQGLGRQATAMVVIDTLDEAGTTGLGWRSGPPGRGWRLQIEDDGTARIPQLGLTVQVQGLSSDNAVRLGDLLGRLPDPSESVVEPAPEAAVAPVQGEADGGVAVGGVEAWRQYADPLGAVQLQFRSVTVTSDGGTVRPGDVPHLAQPEEQAHVSLLPLPAEAYQRDIAAAPADVVALAPAVPTAVAAEILAADPDLDSDLAAWRDPASPRPKVAVLGPVTVTAAGTLPAGRQRVPWNTELVTYLATRTRPVSSDRLAEDLWPGVPGVAGTSRLRQALSVARNWLGHDPATGQPYLPQAARGGDGQYYYRVEGALVDADLFRRLRLRANARGADGIADLQVALDLVTGQPYDQPRVGGYVWLADSAHDHECTAMIADVAHLLAVHHLAHADPTAAEVVARAALAAGMLDDTISLDLIQALDAQNRHAEADHVAAQLLRDHDADSIDDLPTRVRHAFAHRSGAGTSGLWTAAP